MGAFYYIVGAIAHYFDLSIFPWYDGRLYAPYHDTLIAVAAIVISFLLVIIARDPVRNVDTLWAIIISAFVVSVASFAVIWRVDFTLLGAPDKRLQTIFESVLGLVWTAVLAWLAPQKWD